MTGGAPPYPTGRPLPQVNDLTRPFWDAAKKHQLVIQRCQDCRTYQHPPALNCAACGRANLKFERVSGVGRIYSHTWVHDTRLKAFESILPYNVVLVELEEQDALLMAGNMPGTPYEKITTDAVVEVVFIEAGSGITLPDFRLI